MPITNPDWPDRFHVAQAAANDGPGGSNTPNVREDTGGEDIAQVYYFHTQPSGLPEELSDNGGNLVWTAQYSTWGSTLRETWHRLDAAGSPQEHSHSNAQPLQQNLRLQGQYLDRETGLHYNTFRYYDADLGAFTTPDPIGLNGGLNLHQYAPNPIGWVDPWGWAKDCGQPKTTPKLSSPNPVPKKIAHAYEEIKLGRGTPRIDPATGKQTIHEGRDLPKWKGAKEFEARGPDGNKTGDRILEKTLPDGRKIYGYVEGHNYRVIKTFPGPWYPDGGKLTK